MTCRSAVSSIISSGKTNFAVSVNHVKPESTSPAAIGNYNHQSRESLVRRLPKPTGFPCSCVKSFVNSSLYDMKASA